MSHTDKAKLLLLLFLVCVSFTIIGHKNGSAETTVAEGGRNLVAGLCGHTLGEN